MSRDSEIRGIDRIIDANINRAKEGLRVCEEITRFILSSRPLSVEFKKIRHNMDSLCKDIVSKADLIRQRDSLKDVGKNIYVNELKRKNYRDIFFANIQRLKESIRVLEEFSKLIDKHAAVRFKDIRYKVYELEKRAAKRILSLCYRG